MRRPVHAGERDDQPVVELLELRALRTHDVADLTPVLRGQQHAHVAGVAQRGDAREELALRERFWQGEQRGAHRGGEVHLLRESYARVVLDDPDGLVHAPGEVERPPVEQVRAEVVHRRHAILDRLRGSERGERRRVV